MIDILLSVAFIVLSVLSFIQAFMLSPYPIVIQINTINPGILDKLFLKLSGMNGNACNTYPWFFLFMPTIFIKKYINNKGGIYAQELYELTTNNTLVDHIRLKIDDLYYFINETTSHEIETQVYRRKIRNIVNPEKLELLVKKYRQKESHDIKSCYPRFTNSYLSSEDIERMMFESSDNAVRWINKNQKKLRFQDEQKAV